MPSWASVRVKDRMKTFKYGGDIPTHMAKGSGKKKDEMSKDFKAKKEAKAAKEARARQDAARRSRFSPVKTPVHEAETTEVSALRAFLTSLVLLSLILAPVMGLGLYFAWDMATDLFPRPESAFMAGMGIGVLASFVVALLFTRKAIATS